MRKSHLTAMQSIFSRVDHAFKVFLICLAFSSAEQCETKNSEYGYQLKYSTFMTFGADSIEKCYETCLWDRRCCSINYDLRTSVCDHNYLTKTGFPWMFDRKDGSIYAEAQFPDYGSSVHVPSPSCKFIKERKPQAPSGIYWILPLNQPDAWAFEVYCDMDTDGGGWTLVYNYYFTNFTFFSSLNNAVTPIPSWTVDDEPNILVPVSKEPPLNEWTYSAMDFPLWRNIGNEILVKSTITHWIACNPGTGDFVSWKQGSINCRMIKQVADVCLDYVPTKFQIISYCGPALRSDNDQSVYLFDGSTQSCYPTHDPCGTGKVTNHRTDVEDPMGSIYIR